MKLHILVLTLILFVTMGTAQSPLALHYSNLSLISADSLEKDVSGTGFASAMPAGTREGTKSTGVALLLSLVLPGAGEYYAGETGQAQFFLGVEIAAWGALLFNNSYYNSLRSDYQAYAGVHAGVKGSGDKDDQFWIDIGKFDDVYAFNEKRLQDRRPERLYDPEQTVWQWDATDNRLTYDLKRLKASAIKDRRLIYASAILLNHLVSAVNSIRLTRRHNNRLARGAEYRFFVDTPGSAPAVTLGLMARF
ncbi:MAG TPA: hypothetical protein ENJ10_13210 [Caldithrix abyssi]|uniref:DUF5683 domain-containing protein n=1 Tax=Caldithrix abyssi TaxID=187145 RepID=A0A7V1LP79_CALAY|nr:hypothetical protein [Caldithrix abyssi]